MSYVILRKRIECEGDFLWMYLRIMPIIKMLFMRTKIIVMRPGKLTICLKNMEKI